MGLFLGDLVEQMLLGMDIETWERLYVLPFPFPASSIEILLDCSYAKKFGEEKIHDV